jgi:hypothetical protein
MAGSQKQKFWVAETYFFFFENKIIDVNQIYSDKASATCIKMSAEFVLGRSSTTLLQSIKMIKLLQWKRVSILLGCAV